METLFLDAIRTMSVEELRKHLRRNNRHDTLSVVHRNAVKAELHNRAQQARDTALTKSAKIRAIHLALDEHVAQLQNVASDAYGAQVSLWYSSNDGEWKWSWDAVPA